MMLNVTRYGIVAIAIIAGIIIALKDRALDKRSKIIGIGSLIVLIPLVLIMGLAKTTFVEMTAYIVAVLLMAVTGMYLVHEEQN